MAAPARARLEALLRARALDGTLTTAHPLQEQGHRRVPSGVAALDARLGGGWPRGEVSEIVGPRSSGRTWLLVQALAQATRAGELAALIDTTDGFDPGSVAPTAMAWPYLLWVRGVGAGQTTEEKGRGVPDAWKPVVDRAVKAAALVLQATGFAVVVLDLADVPMAAVRRLPFTTWLRLARLVEGRDTACLVAASEPITRSARGVSLRLAATGQGGQWAARHPCARRLAGLAVRAHLVGAQWAGADGDEVEWHTAGRAG